MSTRTGNRAGTVKKVIAGMLLLSAVSFAGLLSAGEARGPRIIAKELSYDFGKVVQGTDVSHVFELSNGGTEPLNIERISSS